VINKPTAAAITTVTTTGINKSVIKLSSAPYGLFLGASLSI
jgi:hypothetical protein